MFACSAFICSMGQCTQSLYFEQNKKFTIFHFYSHEYRSTLHKCVDVTFDSNLPDQLFRQVFFFFFSNKINNFLQTCCIEEEHPNTKPKTSLSILFKCFTTKSG